MKSTDVLQVATAVLLPLFMMWLARRSEAVRKISPVLLCYLGGMLLGNQPWAEFDQTLALRVCAVAVSMAIPLLLFPVNFPAWFRLAGPTVLSFFLCVFSTTAVATGVHFLFADRLPESPIMAGMLTAVYLGCTGNMNAVGLMANASPGTFVMLNTADMLLSFLYLVFLMTLAGPVVGKFLRPFPRGRNNHVAAGDFGDFDRLPTARTLGLGLGLTLVIVAVSGLLAFVVPANAVEGAVIFAITTLALLLSFVPAVRSLKGTQIMGQYFMLVFFTSVGMTSDLAVLMKSSASYFAYTALVIYGAIVLHHALCYVFRIDRDTAIITSTATIFSPPFVPPVALALKNPEVLVSGIATGLVGYAASNYIGIGLIWLLSSL